MVGKLSKAPVIEVIWRLGFEEPVGDMLHGLLFFDLKDKGYVSRKMPGAEIPEVAILNDPGLRNMVRYRLDAEGRNVLFQFGSHFLTVNCQKPYIGWPEFKKEIDQVVKLIRDKCRPNVHSLRYINFLTVYDAPSIEGINLKLELGDKEIKRDPLHIRVEQEENGFDQVIQIATPISVPGSLEQQQGTVLDIETIQSLRGFDQIDENLDLLHSYAIEKFEGLISVELLEKFE